MIKKYVIVLLIISFVNYLGCYSYEQIRGTAIKDQLKLNNNRELHLVTKDYFEYHFDSNMYTLKSDSLFGIGVVVRHNQETPFKGKIALNDIIDIKLKSTSTLGSMGMLIGFAAIIFLAAMVIAIAVDESK